MQGEKRGYLESYRRNQGMVSYFLEEFLPGIGREEV